MFQSNKNYVEKLAFLLLILSYLLPFDFAILFQGIAWLIIAYLTIKNFKENKNKTILIFSVIIIMFTFFILK